MNIVGTFIASPGDVAEERQLAIRVVERLRHEYAEHIELRITAWEQEPLLASADFQSQISTPADSDIFVSLIWSRLGSPLSEQHTRADGSRYLSGTEYEFETALQSYQATGRPSMLVYRKNQPVAEETDEARAQIAALNEFFDKWFINPDQTAKAAYHNFTEPARFEDILELHLRRLLTGYIPKPNNLPVAATPFIGRDKIKASICETILDDDVRLVTLVGPGGTGKTRLGLSVCEKLLDDFDDGVFFVSLVSIKDPELVPSTISDTLSIRESEGRSDTECIIQDLQSKRILLLIDNLEQVQSGGKHLSTMLAACPNLKIIVTSRESLRIKGARTIRVPPLQLPKPNGGIPLNELLDNESVRMFVERAKAAREDFELTADNAGDVIQICIRVDALPLGIELAASRIRSMEPHRLLAALERRFRVLTGGADDLLDHQKSLRELIAWSYDLLDPQEQLLWRRLAIFAGGCSFDAAQVVCDPDDEFMIEIDVESLIDKSLINIQLEETVKGKPNKPARLTMLSTLREYAIEQLVENDEFDELNERFCDWCIDYASGSDAARAGPDLPEWMNKIDLEYDNFRYVIDQARSTETMNPDKGIHLCGSLWFYWYERGNFNEGVSSLEWAVSTNLDTSEESRGRSLLGLSSILRQQGRTEDSLGYASQALDFYTAANDSKNRARALGELGALAQRRGELEEAERHLDECLAIALEQPNDKRGLSFYLTTRGVVDHLLDKLDTAKDYYNRALAVGDEMGDTHSMATALVNLGEIAESENDISAASHFYRESLRLFGDLRLKLAVAYCAEVLAGFEVNNTNRPSQAAFYLGAAKMLREEMGAPIESFNAERLNRDIAKTQAALPEEEFQSAWDAGRGLGMDGILRHALGDDDILSD